MFILLPILAFGGIFLIMQQHHRHPWRDGLLRTVVLWGVTLTMTTELLSGLRQLTPLGVGFAWLGVIGVCALVIHHYGGLSSWTRPSWRWSLPLFPSILLVGVTWIVVITGILAIASPPNNHDSMRYHMSRVMHWIQHRTVAHYPSHNPEQLYQNPGSGFAIAQFQLLSGGDYLANLVQWGSMVLSLVGVSLIARQLGCDRRGQLLAVVLCATIPMGVLQAASTQNDYVVSLWLVCLTYFTLLMVQVGVTASTAIYMGASLGLAILTKGTAYVYAFPLCLVLLLWTIRQNRRRVWQLGGLAVAIALVLNLGHYLRNLALTGSPLGVEIEAETNSVFSLPVFIASFFKHLSLHADWVRALHLENWIVPTTGLTEKIVTIIHNQLGLDINDPNLLTSQINRFYVPAVSQNEEHSSNPVHLILIGLALLVLISYPSLRKQRHLGIYALVLAAGFFLFSSLFTWSPWRTRLHLPIFVLFSPLIARVFVKSFHPVITGCVAIILLLSIQPWLFQSHFKPILGESSVFSKPRLEQYFLSQRHFQSPYQAAITELKHLNCNRLGIGSQRLWFEYPLWILLKQQGFEVSEIYHVAVENSSNQAQLSSHPISGSVPPPCAILSTRHDSDEDDSTVFTYQNESYQVVWSTLVSEHHGALNLLSIK